jgi:DNA-binding response OmpR family regulator
VAAVDILIAEDDPVLRQVYLKKFGIAGHTVRIAQNGQEAVAAIREKSPDILILDFQMPLMDGFQVLETFPKEQRGFPVLALTNFGDEHARQRGDALGVDAYFVKRDMTMKELITKVEELLTKKT